MPEFDWRAVLREDPDAKLVDVEGIPVVGSFERGFVYAESGRSMPVGRVANDGAPATEEEFLALFKRYASP